MSYSLAKSPYKRAMVTGGAGFIGSHLVDSLLADGLEVVSIDNYVAGKKENLEQARSYGEKFHEVDCDITDKSELKKYFAKVDIVFNIAASKMTVCLKDPARDLEVNGAGTLNVMLLAKEFGVKKVVHASTGSVYGTAVKFPTDENHDLNPRSYYGVSKLAGEKYVRAFSDLYGINTSILRYYHVFGPRQDASEVGGVASIFTRRALNNLPLVIYGDGSQIRSFTYVEDVVNINKFVAMLDAPTGEAYNCASGEQVTIQNLAETVLEILEKPEVSIQHEDWRIGDIKFFDVSNEKLRSNGFEYRHTFSSGIRETILWSKKYFEEQDV